MSSPTKLFPGPTDYASVSPPQKLTIPSKPDAPISYSFFQPTNQPNAAPKRLIVFINGLGLPALSWLPSISIFREDIESCPAILTYDRFGQGLTTSRDPLDGTPGKENGHDFLDVANDLHEIIITIATTELGLKASDVEDGTLHLLLIGASIGVPNLRLYAQHHPGITAGAIFLDSNIANVNYSDFWPDPDAPGFDPKTVVADDCTLAQYRGARERLAAMFDLKVKNAEGLDRSTGPALLPYADGPKLVGPYAKGPWLSVVGHDPEMESRIGVRMVLLSLLDVGILFRWTVLNLSLRRLSGCSKSWDGDESIYYYKGRNGKLHVPSSTSSQEGSQAWVVGFLEVLQAWLYRRLMRNLTRILSLGGCGVLYSVLLHPEIDSFLNPAFGFREFPSI